MSKAPPDSRRGKCGNCGHVSDREWVTVRLYRRRKQTEFKYHVCLDCVHSLESLLGCGAEASQHGLFDPPQARALAL